MANFCGYSMRIVGKKENVEEFVKVMQCTYNHRNMVGRIYEADVYDDEDLGNGRYAVELCGDCGWSVKSSMIDGDISTSTTLQLESERLHLDIEVYSEETGIGFQEHYLIRDGHTEIADCVDFYEYYIEDYETKEEAESDNDLTITDEEWNDNDGYIYRGGFDNYCEFSI